MKFYIFATLCLLGTIFTAQVAARPRVPITQGVRMPQGWTATEAAIDRAAVETLHVSLRRPNEEKMMAEVHRRSNPKNLDAYGKWFTMEELEKMIAPSQEQVDRVTTWLAELGVSRTSMNTSRLRDTITVHTSRVIAEEILGQSFVSYKHNETGTEVIKAIGPIHVHEHVADAIEVITGVGSFPIKGGASHVVDKKLKAEKSTKKNTEAYGSAVTPEVITSWYNLNDNPAVPSGNTMAVAEFQGQFINQNDICTFFQEYNVNGTCQVAKYIGQNTQSKPGEESTLDVEYIDVTGTNIPLAYYSFPGLDFCSDLVSWTNALLSEENPPLVHSVSYGVQSYQPICDTATQNKIHANLAAIGGKGLSIIVASGDYGSGQYSRVGYNGGYLVPSWPAESPWVTAVGATTISSNEEVATDAFASGGGFSWTVPTTHAPYQAPALQNFWQNYASSNTLPPSGSYNQQGRGTPDVAALGQYYTIYLNGKDTPGVCGTSAATPVFAGMIARLNNYRLNNGQSALGFLNYMIYQNMNAFTDITDGTDIIGEQVTEGWNCIAGWDPVTGVGSPNYQALLSVVSSLP